MADFIQGLDPLKLIMFETGLAFLLSPFSSPPYNLPILLFGTYALDNAEGIQSMQMFMGLLGGSALFDVIWMMKNEQNGFMKISTFILLLLKPPTFLAFANALRQRGAQFGGLAIHGGDLNGPTVWSMPGGFTSTARDGYMPVDEERAGPPTRSNQSSGRAPHAAPKIPQQAPPKAPAQRPPQASASIPEIPGAPGSYQSS